MRQISEKKVLHTHTHRPVFSKLMYHLTSIFIWWKKYDTKESTLNGIPKCTERDVDRRMRNLIKAPQLKELLW